MHGRSFAAVSLTWVSHVPAVLARALAVAKRQIPTAMHNGTSRLTRCGINPPREVGLMRRRDVTKPRNVTTAPTVWGARPWTRPDAEFGLALSVHVVLG